MNIGAYSTLNLHGFFGANKIRLTIKWVGKMYAFFSDMSKTFFVGRIGYTTLFVHRDYLT